MLGVVRERLDALLMSGASFATNRNDPWEAYRQPAAAAAVPWHHPALVAHRAMEWLPDKATARDANGGDFLARLDGDTLKRLEGGGVGGGGGGARAGGGDSETARAVHQGEGGRGARAAPPKHAREGGGGEGGVLGAVDAAAPRRATAGWTGCARSSARRSARRRGTRPSR